MRCVREIPFFLTPLLLQTSNVQGSVQRIRSGRMACMLAAWQTQCICKAGPLSSTSNWPPRCAIDGAEECMVYDVRAIRASVLYVQIKSKGKFYNLKVVVQGRAIQTQKSGCAAKCRLSRSGPTRRQSVAAWNHVCENVKCINSIIRIYNNTP